MPHRFCFLILSFFLLASCRWNPASGDQPNASEPFVTIAHDDPSYFELSDHTPYIPIGLNMISPGAAGREGEQQGLAEMEGWMKALSENGGNYIRIWLSSPFWDIEPAHAGIYDEGKAQRIDKVLALARKYQLRVKMTLEHFRALTPEESSQSWALKSVYHTSQGGPLDSVRQYITTEAGQSLMLKKLDYYQKRYGSDPVIFGWELWNEMNAMQLAKDSMFFQWNRKMLREVKQRFPKNLAMQSLGSFDNPCVRNTYQMLMKMPGNEIAQVHRYLDLGAPMDICHGPMDVICSDAVKELLSYGNRKPVILAETGAVEPGHSGPSRYYEKDTVGIILHDALFAPFFSGAAGAGMIWHWDQYVAKNNLWRHFDRFAQVVRGVDPVKEKLKPFYFETANLRVYGLKGNETFLLWCRDKENNWQTELRDGTPPRTISGEVLPLGQYLQLEGVTSVRAFDPWINKWNNLSPGDGKIALPDFQRSIVLRGSAK